MIPLLLLCCADPAVAPETPAPRVVVVVIDTLRADVAAEVGIPRADEGRVYSAAWSASPWTSSSTYTLLTGRWPEGRAQRDPASCRLPPGELDAADWTTDHITDSVVVARLYGEDLDRRPALERAAAWLAAPPLGGWALYVHDTGPHQPYGGNSPPTALEDEYSAVTRGEVPIRDDLAAWARVQYRVAAERHARRLGDFLDVALPVADLVIVTSDHGEALGDGGHWGHGHDLHDPEVRVPLIVWGSGVEPGIDDTPVPATCVGETVRRALGSDAGCDLRAGDVRGDVSVGMSVGGQWVERLPGGDA